MLREHIINKHMLDSGHDDPEELLRLGEGRFASELFSLAKGVLRDYKILRRAVSEAKSEHNLEDAEESRNRFFRSAVIFADWLAKHPLEELEDEKEEE
jgi:hypothetical protein